jgi:hypothetical protein
MRTRSALIVCIVCSGVAGCSSRQMYSAGQQWQLNQCRAMESRAERTQCEQGAALSYEDYQAQASRAARP